MKQAIAFFIGITVIGPALAGHDIAGEYSAITETEWYVRIHLKFGGKCETLSGVFSAHGSNNENERHYSCNWELSAGLLTIRYQTGEVEIFKYRDNLSFASIGHQGGAPGFRPIAAEQYPLTDGQEFWRSNEVEKLMQRLRSR